MRGLVDAPLNDGPEDTRDSGKCEAERDARVTPEFDIVAMGGG